MPFFVFFLDYAAAGSSTRAFKNQSFHRKILAWPGSGLCSGLLLNQFTHVTISDCVLYNNNGKKTDLIMNSAFVWLFYS